MTKKRDKPTTQLRCWDCIHIRPSGQEWNRTHDGRPITQHCYRDPNNIIKGLFDYAPACKHFKNKQLS